ncbi:hypothetical protein APR08_006287, partial [Nocardia amikacinitolerans]|nr:hypothetical protein [Nocardia amikacinitolerans]
MAAGEQVSLEQALAHVFGEHFDDPAGAVQGDVVFADLGLPVASGDLEDVLES